MGLQLYKHLILSMIGCVDPRIHYYQLLREVTENQAWEPWILYMLEAVESTATFTREIILAIRNLMDEAMEKTKKTCLRFTQRN